MESFQFFVQMSLYCKIDCVCRAQHSQWRRRGWVPSSTKQIDLALKIIWETAQLHNTLKLEKLTRNFLHLCAIFGEPMLCVSERQPDPKHLPGRQIDLKWYRRDGQNKWRRVSVEICGRLCRTDSLTHGRCSSQFLSTVQTAEPNHVWEEMLVDGLTSEKRPEAFESLGSVYQDHKIMCAKLHVHAYWLRMLLACNLVDSHCH